MRFSSECLRFDSTLSLFLIRSLHFVLPVSTHQTSLNNVCPDAATCVQTRKTVNQLVYHSPIYNAKPYIGWRSTFQPFRMFIVIIVLFHYFLADTFPNRFNFASRSVQRERARGKRKEKKVWNKWQYKVEGRQYIRTHTFYRWWKWILCRDRVELWPLKKIRATQTRILLCRMMRPTERASEREETKSE